MSPRAKAAIRSVIISATRWLGGQNIMLQNCNGIEGNRRHRDGELHASRSQQERYGQLLHQAAHLAVIVPMLLAMTSGRRGAPSPCGSAKETNLDQDAVPRRKKSWEAPRQGRNCVDQLRGLRVGIDHPMVETRHQELGLDKRDLRGYTADDPAATETLRRVGTKRKE